MPLADQFDQEDFVPFGKTRNVTLRPRLLGLLGEREQFAKNSSLLLHQIEQHFLVFRLEIPHPDAEQPGGEREIRMPFGGFLPDLVTRPPSERSLATIQWI